MFRWARARINVDLYPFLMKNGDVSERNVPGKMSGEVVGEGGGMECRDPENQFSFIRKTYKQLMFAIVQVVETFINIRIR